MKKAQRMSYQIQKKNAKDALPALSMATEVIALEKDIKSNVQHRGRNFEIIKAAYEEIKKANGLPSSSKRLCRSGCIRQMNLLLTNWLNRWRELGGVIPVAKPETPKHLTAKDTALKPTSDKRAELELKSYGDLKEMVKLKRNGVPMDVKGRASKEALIDELLK